MVTEDAAGAAELLTVVLLLVVCAFVNVGSMATSPIANAATHERMQFPF